MDILETAPDRVLAVGAHPDDIELWAGGTLAKWSAAGSLVTLLVCTDGAAGSADRTLDASAVIAERTSEQQAAAKEMGSANVITLGHADGGLEDTAAFRGQIVRAIREHRPEVVLSHDPQAQGFVHRDHRIVGQVVMDAIYPYARDHLHYPEQVAEGLEPHGVDRCLLWEANLPNAVVDISDQFEAKLAALGRHVSQIPGIVQGTDLDVWLRARTRKAAHGFVFGDGELFRMLEAPAWAPAT